MFATSTAQSGNASENSRSPWSIESVPVKRAPLATLTNSQSSENNAATFS